MTNHDLKHIELNKKLVSTPLGVKVELMDIYGRASFLIILATEPSYLLYP
jgi:hypothetical protein